MVDCESEEYAFLVLVTLTTVIIGVMTTSKPLEQFFIESTVSAARTTAAMAWITWFGLVLTTTT